MAGDRLHAVLKHSNAPGFENAIPIAGKGQLLNLRPFGYLSKSLQAETLINFLHPCGP